MPIRSLLILMFLCCAGANAEESIQVYVKKIQDATRAIVAEPVNNAPIIPPFPVANKKETLWDIKLKEYIYAYQVRYGNIGDRFVMPEDIDELLASLPHGTSDRPTVDPVKQDRIAKVFDEEYEENIVNQYFRMQYRVMAPTMR